MESNSPKLVVKHYTRYCNQGDDDVTSSCGLVLSTWDNPIKYTFKSVEVNCPKCWELQAQTDAIKDFHALETAAWNDFDSIVHARVLIKNFLNGTPLTEKAEKWVKDHGAYSSKWEIERYLKDE